MRLRRALVALCIGATGPLAAQEQTGPAATRRDSIARLEAMKELVPARRDDAVFRHDYGVLGMALLGTLRRTAPIASDPRELALLEALESLRAATRLAPDSVRYHLDLGRFHLLSTLAHERVEGERAFAQAVAAARRVGGSAAMARAADEIGRLYWIMAQREPTNRSAEGAAIAREDIDTVRLRERWPPGRDIVDAERHFQLATDTDPGTSAYLRHLTGVLATQRRWLQLERLAVARTVARPWDATAWLVRGLAARRLERDDDAAAAFDSALVLLPEEERSRLTRVSRILTPSDSARLHAVDSVRRRRLERSTWIALDPLWTTPANEPLVEILARVVHAEALWSMGTERGADTDPGIVLVRFGPPASVRVASQGATWIGIEWRYPRPTSEMPGASQLGSRLAILDWRDRQGPRVSMRLSPLDGRVSLADPLRHELARLLAVLPVSWENVPLMSELDSITVHAARFRTERPDSADLYISANVPIGRFVRDVELARVRLRTDLWLLGSQLQPVLRDSTEEILPRDSNEERRTRVWRRRLAAGTYTYRVEAWQPDAARGARGAGPVADTTAVRFSLTGFGVSDVLVAETVTPRSDSAARWTDFGIVPNAGRLDRGQQVAVLWETYGLAARGGRSRYQVTLTMTSARQRPIGGLLAQVTAGVAGTVGLQGRGSSQVSLTYRRDVPHSAVVVDHLTLHLGTTPPGEYTIGVEVTDLETNARAERRTVITVADPPAGSGRTPPSE